MKILVYITLAFTLTIACKEQPKTITPTEKPIEISIAQKIANAHGFKTWQHVSKIEFTFNNRRSWLWEPKTGAISFITDNDTLSYNRKAIDSLSLKADRSFINDKFWLLIPFQLIWDTNATISKPIMEQAPISKFNMNKITLTYPNQGGYTPGDAYDLYYGEDFIIKEWVFRKGNQDQASLINTFENYKNHNGLVLASDHKKGDSDWNLTLTNIKIVLD